MNASRHSRSQSRADRSSWRTPQKQLLHLVFGGELENVADVTFKDLDKLDIVGVYPNYASAYAAWKAKAQGTVDNAQMRYFIVHLHRLLDPTTTRSAETTACSFGGASAGSNGQRRRSVSSPPNMCVSSTRPRG